MYTSENWYWCFFNWNKFFLIGCSAVTRTNADFYQLGTIQIMFKSNVVKMYMWSSREIPPVWPINCHEHNALFQWNWIFQLNWNSNHVTSGGKYLCKSNHFVWSIKARDQVFLMVAGKAYNELRFAFDLHSVYFSKKLKAIFLKL